MQLTQTKALSILNNHHTGIGHIHTHLNHRGCHQDLRLATHKSLHLFIFVLRFHLSVHHRDAVLRKGLAELIVAVGQVLQIQFLIFINERIYYIHLPSYINLLRNKLVNWRTALDRIVERLYWFTPRRQLINDTHLQVAIYCHRQSARNRGGCHYEYMWRLGVLVPQFGTLCHTKAVLLINDA